ncbi:MAG: HupE/UreJ family protein [Steroidobacteraceae bacterium]
MKGILRLLPALLGAILLSSQARSHEIRPAYLQIDETAPDRFDVLWKQPSRGTLALHLAPKLSNGLLDVASDYEYTTSSFVIRRWKGRPLARDAFDGATVRVEGLEHTLTDALVIISFANGQQIQTLLKSDNPAFDIHLAGTGKMPAAAYLTLGIQHILTGFDHLSFVLCLVLLVSGRLKLLKTITAFTIAHSITLATAALGYVQVRPPLIESLVALSIVFVAVELTRSWKGGHQGVTVRYPWLIAFTFGLLHGFAFAGSLADIGLPPHNIPGALLLFNCGVEIGQLLFVGAVLAVIAILNQLRWADAARSGRWLVSYGVGALASYWMLERASVLIH